MKLRTHFAIAITSAIALAALATFTGCKSNITNLREQFSPTYHDIVVEADENAAYLAALTALTQMGYTITSSGAAQKKIEAMSAISPGGPSRSARQITASVRTAIAPNNCTAIQILFTEIRDDGSSTSEGLGTKQPLADSGLYGVFANYANAALKSQRQP